MSRDELSLITVRTISNPAELGVAESILTEAGIRYLAKNETLQSTFGWGRPDIGGVELQVREQDEIRARELLDVLDENPERP